MRVTGSYRWLQWTACPRVDQGLIYAVARDVTDQKQSQARIRELNAELVRRIAAQTALNQELEAFSYSVSHDLRAPLRIIDGFSGILLKDHADTLDAEARRVTNVIRQSTQTRLDNYPRTVWRCKNDRWRGRSLFLA